MFSDLKFALRLLAKSPVFAAIAVLTLAVGIGTATVIFSAVNALFLKPIPFIQDVDRLLYFTEADLKRGHDDLGLNYSDFRDLRARMTTLEGMWVHSDRTIIMSGTADPERLIGTDISAEAFQWMGVQPALGRNFVPADEQRNAPRVALLSYGLWQRRFGGSNDVLNSNVTLNGETVTVIGVMPKGWGYPDMSDLWMPLRIEEEKQHVRGSFWLNGRVKMKPGVMIEQVRAEGTAVMAAIAKENPVSNDNIQVRFTPLREEAVQEVSQFMKLLFGAVLFVFLISCLNVANLLLARSSSRSREIAVRLALGADRRRLLRQLLTESLLLGLLGGAGGLLVSLWGLDLMVSAIPIELPFWLQFDIDGRVFAFVTIMSVVAAVIFGVAPAIRAMHSNPMEELKDGGRTSDEPAAHTSSLRNTLVVVEVAIALILLVGAGLLARSFYYLKNVNPGFVRENVLSFRTGFPPGLVKSESETQQFFHAVQSRLEALPGVVSVASTGMFMQNQYGGLTGVILEGAPPAAKDSDLPIADVQTVSPSYFATMQIPLLAGRLLTEQDDEKAPPVAVVALGFANKFFGSPENAIGKRFQMPKRDEAAAKWIEIVGVVGDVVMRPDSKHRYHAFYATLSQHNSNFRTMLVRTSNNPALYAEQARLEVLAVNRGIPIYHVFTLEDIFIRSVWTRQFFSRLFTASGFVALFLACVGIYGVMTYNVSQRTQELGMRMALGAQPGTVIGMVLGDGFRLLSIGLILGLMGAFFCAQLLESVLYGVSPHDPPTFALVPVLLIAVGLLACYLPTRRVTRIDPNSAIRCE